MSSSSPEVISSASFEAAPSAPRAKTSSKAAPRVGEGPSQTRELLADTVGASADKVDVPSGVTDKVHATKDTVHAKLGQVTRHLQDSTETMQAKAEEVTRQVKSLPNQVPAQVATPVAGRVNHLTQALRQRPALAAAVVFTVLVLLLFRRLFRKAE